MDDAAAEDASPRDETTTPTTMNGPRASSSAVADDKGVSRARATKKNGMVRTDRKRKRVRSRSDDRVLPKKMLATGRSPPFSPGKFVLGEFVRSRRPGRVFARGDERRASENVLRLRFVRRFGHFWCERCQVRGRSKP